jgi:hypothetical protein
LRVQVTFNPSENSDVDIIKQKTAELINFCAGLKTEKPSEKSRLVALAQTSYEEAAMWAVKAAPLSKLSDDPYQ